MRRLCPLLLAALLVTAGCRPGTQPEPDPLRLRADSLVQAYIIVDGHIDVPYRLTANPEDDITGATEFGDFDYVRARQGGLDAPFMSIYIPSGRQETPGAAKALADSLIDMVEGFAEQAPEKYAVATSPDEIERHKAEGLISLPMGMENGAPIEDDLGNVAYFYDRGIRYVTLTHARDNQISDSSYDTTRTWNGLSPFGEDVVREMNRLGMLVDVSHISDSAFYDVMRITTAPVIASHSSARVFTPGFERNMSDALIRRLAGNGGVIMINFGSSFLRTEYQDDGARLQQQIMAYMTRNGLDRTSPEAIRYFREQRKANPVGSVDDVVAHIEHVKNLVGIDHIGLGSDYDGVFALPAGLDDVSDYANLVYALLQRGYSDGDIEKILGGNVLRVWREAQR